MLWFLDTRLHRQALLMSLMEFDLMVIHDSWRTLRTASWQPELSTLPITVQPSDEPFWPKVAKSTHRCKLATMPFTGEQAMTSWSLHDGVDPLWSVQLNLAMQTMESCEQQCIGSRMGRLWCEPLLNMFGLKFPVNGLHAWKACHRQQPANHYKSNWCKR